MRFAARGPAAHPPEAQASGGGGGGEGGGGEGGGGEGGDGRRRGGLEGLFYPRYPNIPLRYWSMWSTLTRASLKKEPPTNLLPPNPRIRNPNPRIPERPKPHSNCDPPPPPVACSGHPNSAHGPC